MEATSNNKHTGLKVTLAILTVAAVGGGIYWLWDYERIKKINAKVTSASDAIAIISSVK